MYLTHISNNKMKSVFHTVLQHYSLLLILGQSVIRFVSTALPCQLLAIFIKPLFVMWANKLVEACDTRQQQQSNKLFCTNTLLMWCLILKSWLWHWYYSCVDIKTNNDDSYVQFFKSNVGWGVLTLLWKNRANYKERFYYCREISVRHKAENSYWPTMICTVSKYGNVHGQFRQSLTARDFHPVIKNNLYLKLCWFV